MSVEIKNKYGTVLKVVKGADMRHADLRGANLRGADLGDADLRHADLRGAYLCGADLRGAYLHHADLRGADMHHADLRGADLRGANLRGADLGDADLRGANLGDADLGDADLRGAYLCGANLGDANLGDADLRGATNIPDYVIAHTSILPESGPVFGWKKCQNGVLVQVVVGAKAKRSNATGRKCRAEYVEVLEVIGDEVGISTYDGKTEYRKGAIVRCDKWEEDRWQECASGIHFFLTRYEAANY